MDLKIVRNVLKACSEDTRLRIINILSDKELSVNEICSLLEVSQPEISKHLVRLRLLKIAVDRREGNQVYYRLNRDLNSVQGKVVNFILSRFKDVPSFIEDREVLEKKL